MNNVSGNPSDLFMLDSQNGFMITNFGQMYRTTDGWETSTVVNYIGSLVSYDRIFFLNDNIGFLVGYIGHVRKTVDGGNTWTNVNIPTSFLSSGETLTDIHFVNESIGFATSSGGNVFKTTDQGTTWIKIQLQPSQYQLDEVLFINENIGFAVGALGQIYRTADQGITWEINDTEMGIIYDIRLHNGILHAVGSGATFSTSSDNGLTWSTVQTVNNPNDEIPSNPRLYAVTFLGNQILVAGESGMIYTKSLSDTSWSIFYKSILGGMAASSLEFSNDNQGVMVGFGFNQSAVYYTADGGNQWQRKLTAGGSTPTYRSAHVRPDGKGLLVGQGGYRMTTNSGETWSNSNSIVPSTSYTDCWLKDNNEFFVGTNPGSPPTDGMIMRTAANTWVQFTDMIQITEIEFYDEMIGYAALGNENYPSNLWKTIDGGNSWSLVTTYPGGLPVRGIQVVSADKVYVRNLNLSNVSTDGGQTWTSLTSPDYPTVYHFFDELNGYGIHNTTKHVYKTENGGDSWEIMIENDNSLCGLENLAWFEDRIVYAGPQFMICILDIEETLQIHPVQSGIARKVVLYPNPTKNIINISENAKLVSLSDITGKMLASYADVNVIDISDCQSGIYFITILTNDGIKSVQKIVKE